MFVQTFNNIDDILHKDVGCGSELDSVEQTSRVLFLKYLDDLERDRKEETALRLPQDILEEMKALDEESALIMDNLQLIINY